MIQYSSKQKLVLRILSIPAVVLLLLVLYVVKYVVHVVQFTRFGGEFHTYGKDEVATIDKIYQKLKEDRLSECSNCGEKVEMVSSGEFCPKCYS